MCILENPTTITDLWNVVTWVKAATFPVHAIHSAYTTFAVVVALITNLLACYWHYVSFPDLSAYFLNDNQILQLVWTMREVCIEFQADCNIF